MKRSQIIGLLVGLTIGLSVAASYWLAVPEPSLARAAGQVVGAAAFCWLIGWFVSR